MRIKYIAVIAALAANMGAFAVTPAVISRTLDNGSNVTVTAVSDYIFRVVNTAPGESVRASRASVLPSDGAGVDVAINENSGNVSMTTVSGLTATIDAKGRLIIDGGAQHRLEDDGLRTMADGKRRLELKLAGNGSFYGAGERGHKLNLRGDSLVMYNRQNYGYTGSDPRISQMNITMPLVLSTDGYGLVFDDYSASTLVLSDPLVYLTESAAPVAYYFVNSNGSLADLTTNMTELTGRQELPPLWTLGYITSKYGYKDENDALDAVDKLKEMGYPLDGIVFDLYWYGKEQDMGRLAWDKKQWPDPKWTLDYLKQKGVKAVTITQPYILRNGRGLDNYNELASKGMLVKDAATGKPLEVKIWVGEGGMFDMSNPDTRRWLTDRMDSLMNYGIGGWWGDLGEPEVHPENGMHANGLATRQYHNQYGNDWSEIVYNLYKERYPDRRLISMMRGGTTGLQRYDVFPWSTDVSRSWGGLEPQVRIMLNSGLSGLGYMSHDVGGFAIDEAAPYDPELYVRWLQLGLFSPMLRTHAQQTAEPFHYPDQQNIIKPVIMNRYRWLPYNYTLGYENATKGWPLVRPLGFHDMNPDGRYDNISDQYLWGRDVMVAPVMTKGTTERSVVFPEGSLWIDMNNPLKTYKGGTTATVAAPLDVLPVFVRGGAFIPVAAYPMRSTDNYRINNYRIDYYPVKGESASGYMWEDDTRTPSSVSGNNGRTIRFDAIPTDKDKFIDVTLSAEGSYPGASDNKTITFAFVGLDKEPAWIEVDGKNSRITWDKATGTASVGFVWNVTRECTIRLKR